MKKAMGLMFLAMFVLQGCSENTANDLEELGHDAKRDINKAARNIDDKVQDAVD